MIQQPAAADPDGCIDRWAAARPTIVSAATAASGWPSLRRLNLTMISSIDLRLSSSRRLGSARSGQAGRPWIAGGSVGPEVYPGAIERLIRYKTKAPLKCKLMRDPGRRSRCDDDDGQVAFAELEADALGARRARAQGRARPSAGRRSPLPLAAGRRPGRRSARQPRRTCQTKALVRAVGAGAVCRSSPHVEAGPMSRPKAQPLGARCRTGTICAAC